MQLGHAIAGLEAAVETQLRLAGPEAAEAGSHFLNALMPAIRESMMNVTNMAATEISSQLPAQKVEIRLIDGDPELVVIDDEGAVPPPPPPPPGEEDNEARITVRLPSYLKDLIADAADTSGDSVNTYVVESLKTSTREPRKGGATRHRTTIEL